MEAFNPNQDFIKMEHEILKFWEENRCFDKLREKNRNNEPFRFLDGPITANNPMGIHHAWGRTVKDSFIRYKAMQGHSCHYRNGFDTQGLWVEVEVEKELGFKSKKDIEHFGMARFTEKCVERIKKYSGIITEQSKRLGQWMDWDNSYYTHADENITGIWSFLKKCHEKGWLGQSHRPMPWCPRCGTSLSEHEMTGSYKEIEHQAVFFKLPLAEENWDILVWTTTPWTLSANVALAVNGDIDYCLVEHEEGARPMVLAHGALKHLTTRGKVLRIFKGKELEGLHYETCFPDLHVQGLLFHQTELPQQTVSPHQTEIPQQAVPPHQTELPRQSALCHSIVLWDMVSAEEGSGVVHIAPGCGAEDYELGQALGLPSPCPIDEEGVFTPGYGSFSGLKASEAPPYVFEALKKQGKLYKTHPYTHSYPVCWRCKTEVLFRLVREWHIKTDEVRPQLLEAAAGVKWEPEYIGKRMQDWLTNMGDWNISRKRFYGLPLPFYPCTGCGRLTVVGSKKELSQLGGPKADALPELHRPWIDEVEITCPHCKSKVKRVTEVGDVWLDAGIVAYSTLGYFEDKEKWKASFPAQWVTEMREQVRLWFYSLLFMSVTLEGRAPYEKVMAHSSVIAEDGTKFSKTGFMIRFDEAAEKLGADTIRYLFAGAGFSTDVRFGYKLGEEARRKLLAFWNIYAFFMTYASLEKPRLSGELPQGSPEIADLWLLARTDSFIRATTEFWEDARTQEVVKAFEAFVEDVSNWYVRTNRKRFWKQGRSESKQWAYRCLYTALKAMLQVMAPVLPFLTEHVWQAMVRVFEDSAEESVHLSSWPQPLNYREAGERANTLFKEDTLLEYTETVRKLIGTALKLRNEAQLKVKQPLSCLYAVVPQKARTAAELIRDTLLDELNVKSLVFLENTDRFSEKYLTLNFKKAGGILKEKVNTLKGLLEGANRMQTAELVRQLEEGEGVAVPGWDEPLPGDLFTLSTRYRDNLAVSSDKEMTLALDTAITEDLLLEGLYRELLRQCQLFRKEAGLEVDKAIRLALKGEDEQIGRVLKLYGKKIAEETLAQEVTEYLAEPCFQKETEVGGYRVQVQIGVN